MDQLLSNSENFNLRDFFFKQQLLTEIVGTLPAVANLHACIRTGLAGRLFICLHAVQVTPRSATQC